MTSAIIVMDSSALSVPSISFMFNVSASPVSLCLPLIPFVSDIDESVVESVTPSSILITLIWLTLKKENVNGYPFTSLHLSINVRNFLVGTASP